jgi:hypothetical protein
MVGSYRCYSPISRAEPPTPSAVAGFPLLSLFEYDLATCQRSIAHRMNLTQPIPSLCLLLLLGLLLVLVLAMNGWFLG